MRESMEVSHEEALAAQENMSEEAKEAERIASAKYIEDANKLKKQLAKKRPVNLEFENHKLLKSISESSSSIDTTTKLIYQSLNVSAHLILEEIEANNKELNMNNETYVELLNELKEIIDKGNKKDMLRDFFVSIGTEAATYLFLTLITQMKM